MRARLVVMALVAVITVTGFAIGGDTSPHPEWVTRGRITIEGDADFTPQNGVVGGSGTKADPYRIEGWFIDIDSDPRRYAISIANTSAHVSVSGNGFYVSNPSSFDTVGVQLTGVSNVLVRGNHFGTSYIRFAVRVEGSEGVQVDANNFVCNEVYIRKSNRVVVAGNLSCVNGIAASDTSNLTIRDNTIRAWGFPGYGVSMWGVRNALVAGNTIQVAREARALELWGGKNVTVRGNQVTLFDPSDTTGFTYGMTLEASESIHVEDNVVLGILQGPSIEVKSSKGIALLRNKVSNGRAVVIESTQDVVAAGNTLTGVGGLGMYFGSCYWSVGSLALTGSTNATLTDNLVLRGGGIDVWGSSQVTVFSNRVTNSSHGVLVTASSDVRIAFSTFEGNQDGLTTVPSGGWGGWGCPQGVDSAPPRRLLVENSTIRGSLGWGLRLSGTDHAVRNVTSVGNGMGGVSIVPHPDRYGPPFPPGNIRIESNRIENNSGPGIRVDRATSYARLWGNGLLRNRIGIASVNSSVLDIRGNEVVDSQTDGVTIDSSAALIRGNRIANSSGDGLRIRGSTGPYVVGNRIESNSAAAVALEGVQGARVFWNAFLNHSAPARDDAGATNVWNLSYPDGGNYWSNLPGPDVFQGPLQDIPGADGIVDVPFVIDADSEDRYPLALVPGLGGVPAAPQGLLIALAGSDTVLAWQLPEDFPGNPSYIGFSVERGDSFDPAGTLYSRIAFVDRQATQFVDAGAGRGDSRTHFYRVCAFTVALDACTPQVVKWAYYLGPRATLLGVPVDLTESGIATVFENMPVAQALGYAANETVPWRRWTPQGQSGWNVTADAGLWVDASAGFTLTVAGPLPATRLVAIRPGWNLLAYPEFTGRPVASWLAGISYTRLEVFDLSAAPYFLRRVTGDHSLRAGDAVWVYAQSAGVIVTGH